MSNIACFFSSPGYNAQLRDIALSEFSWKARIFFDSEAFDRFAPQSVIVASASTSAPPTKW